MSYIIALRKGSQILFEKLDKITIGKNKRSLFGVWIPFYQFVIYFGIITYFLLMLVFMPVNYTNATGLRAFPTLLGYIIHPVYPIMNPILNRGLDNGGHILAYLSLMCLALVARAKLPKTSEGFYFSLLIPTFFLSMSEGLFNIFYWVLNYHLWPHPSWFYFILVNPLAMLYIFSILIAVIVTPIWKYLSLKRTLIALAVIVGYFFVWSAFGLPVTLSSISYLRGTGLETQYFPNLWVNLTELSQWTLASICGIFSIKVIMGTAARKVDVTLPK